MEKLKTEMNLIFEVPTKWVYEKLGLESAFKEIILNIKLRFRHLP